MQKGEGIEEFVAVAETNSFTAAAKRLGVSTAHVSRQVTGLEERLGAKLFYRTTRKVTTTEVGSTYYQHCRQILDSMAQAAEGIWNCAAARDMAHERGVAVPIADEVYAIVHQDKNPADAVASLMERDVKPE